MATWCSFFSYSLLISDYIVEQMNTPRPYMLAESTWDQLQTRDIQLAILPWGACEAHNYHLPYATDIIEADHIASRAGDKAYQQGAAIVILPTIPFGVNTGQTDILLDINIYPSTQYAILDNVIEVLDRQGISKLLVLNSHGGNNFQAILRELGVKYPSMLLTCCDWYKACDRSLYFDHEGDHADEMETSVMMHLVPHLVRALEVAGDGAEKKIKVSGIREGWAWTERRWSQVTADTGIGDPREATPEKGKRFLEDTTDQVARLMIDLCNVDINDLYE